MNLHMQLSTVNIKWKLNLEKKTKKMILKFYL